MTTRRSKTPATLKRHIRQLTRFCGSLIVDLDKANAELAKIKNEPEPLPFMDQAERLGLLKTQRAPR